MTYRIIFCRKNKRDENPLVHKVATIFIVARYKGVGHYSNSITEARKVILRACVELPSQMNNSDLHGMKYDTNIYCKVLRTKINKPETFAILYLF